jgi:hypothetical protein
MIKDSETAKNISWYDHLHWYYRSPLCRFGDPIYTNDITRTYRVAEGSQDATLI